MKNLKRFQNENGGMAALMSVIILSGIAITTLTSAYIFLENRAKYNARIISGYQTAYAMEDIAVNLRQVYDASLNIGAMTVVNGTLTATNAAACAAGTIPQMMQGMMLCIPSLNYSQTAAFGCTSAPCFCIQTSAATGSVGNRYCMNISDQVIGGPGPFVSEVPAAAKTFYAQERTLKKWLARMDRFFDVTVQKETAPLQSSMYAFLGYELKPPTLLGWILPQSARASDATLAVAETRSTGDKTADKTYEQDRGHIGMTVSDENPSTQKEKDDADNRYPSSDESIGGGSLSIPVSRCLAGGSGPIINPKEGGLQTPPETGTTEQTSTKTATTTGSANEASPSASSGETQQLAGATQEAGQLSLNSLSDSHDSGGIVKVPGKEDENDEPTRSLDAVAAYCEQCAGIGCVRLTLPSVMCAGIDKDCPYGSGTINVKFE